MPSEAEPGGINTDVQVKVGRFGEEGVGEFLDCWVIIGCHRGMAIIRFMR